MVSAVSQIDSNPPIRVPRSEFVAGRIALAFCNTVALPNAADRLADPQSLASWAGRAGRALDVAPGESEFRDLLALRDLLREIFGRVADGTGPLQASLDLLAAMAGPQRLVWNDPARRADLRPGGDAVTRLKQAIVADAIDLLTGPALFRVKRCAAHDCRWFFLDASRNGTRRWCAMEVCGLKEKVQRHRGRLEGRAAF
jgi:predicted RNA-binding Zn ribbon-like protein